MKSTTQTTKTTLNASLMMFLLIPFATNAFADHPNTSRWSTDREYDIQYSLNNISHPIFTPATDFDDAVDVWNSVSSS